MRRRSRVFEDAFSWPQPGPLLYSRAGPARLRPEVSAHITRDARPSGGARRSGVEGFVCPASFSELTARAAMTYRALRMKYTGCLSMQDWRRPHDRYRTVMRQSAHHSIISRVICQPRARIVVMHLSLESQQSLVSTHDVHLESRRPAHEW